MSTVVPGCTRPDHDLDALHAQLEYLKLSFIAEHYADFAREPSERWPSGRRATRRVAKDVAGGRVARGGGPERREGSEPCLARRGQGAGRIARRLKQRFGEVAEWSKALDWNSSNI